MNDVSFMFCLSYFGIAMCSIDLVSVTCDIPFYLIFLNVVFNFLIQLIITVIIISIVRSWFLSDVSWLIIWTFYIKIYITVIVHNYRIIVYTLLLFFSHILASNKHFGVCSGGIIKILSQDFLTGRTTGVSNCTWYIDMI